MQPKRDIDWQIRKLLRKHKVPPSQMREDTWKGIAAALDEQQPVRRPWGKWTAGVAALLIAGSAIGVYFHTNTGEPGSDARAIISQKRAGAPLVIAPDKKPADQVRAGEFQENPGITGLKNMPAGFESNLLSGRSLANLQLAKLIKPFSAKEISRINGQVEEKLDPIALRGQAIKILSSLSQPLPAALRVQKRKRAKGSPMRDPGTWTSLFINIWDNPAYTGAAGRLSFSYDDNSAFFDYWRNGIYRDYFALDGRIPKTPFSVGVYHDRGINAYSMKAATAFTVSARVLPLAGGYLSLGGGISRLSRRYFTSANAHYSEPAEFTFGLKEVTQERTFTTLNTALSLEAGAWYQAKNIIAGVSVKNANQPFFGYTEQGERINRSWHFTGGYRMGLGKFMVTPLLEVERNKLYSQASVSAIATFDDKISIGGAIRNISPVTLRGERLAYAGFKACNRLTVFTSYGRNMEMAAKGIDRHIIHTGLRFQLPR